MLMDEINLNKKHLLQRIKLIIVVGLCKVLNL